MEDDSSVQVPTIHLRDMEKSPGSWLQLGQVRETQKGREEEKWKEGERKRERAELSGDAPFHCLAIKISATMVARLQPKLESEKSIKVSHTGDSPLLI